MSKRLLDYDPVTRTSTYHEYDHSTQQTHIETVQDCSKIVDHTTRLANDSSYKARGIKTDWYHCATVPNSILLKIMKEHNLDWRNKDDLDGILKVVQRDYKKLLTVNRI